MEQKRIHQAILGSLVADAYALGSHWVYDEHQLASLPIDWNAINPPQALWHKGKTKGDYTHYGDHTVWLYDFILQNGSFSIEEYKAYWCRKMENYSGYIDGSSRDTLALLKQDSTLILGAASHDLSIIGRIAPLLLASSDQKMFLQYVDEFVSFTHNTPIVKEAAQFFGRVLFEVTEGKSITDALSCIPIPDVLADRYHQALLSQDKESFNAIRTFGPACAVEGGFEGVIHLLLTYTDYQEAMIANAKAGGDTAARGMIVGMLLAAQGSLIPPSWEKSVHILRGNTANTHG